MLLMDPIKNALISPAIDFAVPSKKSFPCLTSGIERPRTAQAWGMVNVVYVYGWEVEQVALTINGTRKCIQ